MRHCPKCNKPSADASLVCSQCGTNLQEAFEESKTVDIPNSLLGSELEVQEEMDLDASDLIDVIQSEFEGGRDPSSVGNFTIDSADPNLASELTELASSHQCDLNTAASSPSDINLVDNENFRATVATELSSHADEIVFESKTSPIDQTLDASKVLGADHALIDLPSEVGSRDDQTIDVSGITLFAAEQAVPISSVETENGTLAIDDINSNGSQTIEYEQQAISDGTDNEATVLLDEKSPSNKPLEQTIQFGSEVTAQKTLPSDDSGTDGRLKRMWQGVVGSSANPMHSLSAMSMQASEAIFERVATRRVVNANASPTVETDYRIVDKLGEGAMGIVFTARQTSVDRLVALKAAKPNFQKNEEARRRFLYEAQITADLDHSNIVPIHELGVSEDGMLFYSMKIVEGSQWNRVMRGKSREQNLDIFMKVADAVAFAHSKGIIHRDLKPENTMLGKFGEVFVTDWGTAINLNRDSSQIAEAAAEGDRRVLVANARYFRPGDSIVITNDEEVLERNEIGAVQGNEITLRKKLSQEYCPAASLRVVKAFNMAGTPCYMAPEMAGHQLNRLGCTSDIYVLGGILFDLVTGCPPHSGPTVTHCLKNALKNDLTVPLDLEEDALLAIALKALSTDPRDRYASVEQMQDAVRQYRRHAESISSTERSMDLLEQAKAAGDYESYSRAMFGFQEAIELWPENSAAKNGLLLARRSYADIAYSKGDFDLVLQTVDTTVPEEKELFSKAQQAKQKRVERESRIKKLQRLVTTVVILAMFGLSGLLLYAFKEQRKAVAAASAEASAKLGAEQKRSEAEAAKAVAEGAQIEEEKQRKLAVERQIDAEARRQEAVEAQKAEAVAKHDAQRKAIQIQLDEYKSSIALASSRLASFDVRSTNEILKELIGKASNISNLAPPAFDSWGWQRINLLGNSDLPQVTIAGRAIASTASAGADVIAVATDAGEIKVFDVQQGLLTVRHSHFEPNAKLLSLALSCDGSKLAFAYSTENGGGMKFWQLGNGIPEPVESAGKRMFQQLTFSRDGQYIVAGINAGLWIWNTTANGWLRENLPSARVNNVRGELIALQQVSDTEYLLTVDFDQNRELRLVNVAQSTNEPISLPSSMEGLLISVRHIGDSEVAIGLSDNRVAIARLDRTNLINEIFFEQKHVAAVTQFVQDKFGRLISMSDAEPVAQIWRKENGQWQYLSYLAGLSNNLVNVLAISNGLVIGLDSSDLAAGASGDSRAIVWDINRQIQRSRMERPMEDGKDVSYPASVQHVFVGGYRGNALTVDAKGCVNAWSLKDGTIHGVRFAYLGHTPGAEMVDSAISLESQLLVTVARLRNANRAYMVDREATWEFCLWDLTTKQMIRRWTRKDVPLPGQAEAASIEPRLTLVDHGSKLLIGSDTQTTIVDAKTGTELFSRSDWGSYFAIENPQIPSQVLLIKRSGAIRLLDLDRLRWDEGKVDDISLIIASETAPVQAVWSPSGKHFYFAYANGDVAKLAIVGKEVKILWHSAMLDNDLSDIKASLKLKSGEVRLHNDMDLMLEIDANSETLHYAVRSGSSERRTEYVSVQFSTNADKPISITSNVEFALGNRWLNRMENGEVGLAAELHEQLSIDTRRVRIVHKTGPSIFVSTRSAQTYAITNNSDSIDCFARTPARSATGDSSGSVVYVLQADGFMTRYSQGNDDEIQVKSLAYALPNATAIRLSNDGKFLAVTSDRNLSIHDPESGLPLNALGSVAALCWNPTSVGELVTCGTDGTINFFDSSFRVIKQSQHVLRSGEEVVGLHFLTETFGNVSVQPRQHLIVHTRDSSNDYANIVSIDPLPAVLTQAGNNAMRSSGTMRQVLSRNSLIAVSPKEGVFATGNDNGTVNVWFCNPTWGEPRELFDLNGHRGAKITSIVFTNDGRTLVTADNNKRVYAWLSKDPMGIRD